MSTLTGKVALVTGGSRGIGAAIARRLASDGAHVALTYNRSSDVAQSLVQELSAKGVEAEAFQFSADESAAASDLIDAVVERFGRLDILVNNAAVYIPAPLAEVSDEDYAATFDTNVRGPFVTVRKAAEHLSDGGRIINIGSVNANVGFPGQTAYAASKAALSSFTGVWAKELGARGITVNIVQPGPVDTDMNPADPDKNPMAETIGGMTVLGRYGTVDEIAAAAAFLASPDASYITGSELTVDGGLTA